MAITQGLFTVLHFLIPHLPSRHFDSSSVVVSLQRGKLLEQLTAWEWNEKSAPRTVFACLDSCLGKQALIRERAGGSTDITPTMKKAKRR